MIVATTSLLVLVVCTCIVPSQSYSRSHHESSPVTRREIVHPFLSPQHDLENDQWNGEELLNDVRVPVEDHSANIKRNDFSRDFDPARTDVDAGDHASFRSDWMQSTFEQDTSSLTTTESDDETAPAGRNEYWTSFSHTHGLETSVWFGGSHEAYSKLTDYPIAAMECSGGYSANLRYWSAHSLTNTPMLSHDGATWTKLIRSEKSPNARCPVNTLVSQIYCGGSKCSAVKFKCSRVVKGMRIMHSLPGYSVLMNKNSRAVCINGYYLTGLKCSKRYCQNLRLYCTKVQVLRHMAPVWWKLRTERM